MLLFLFAVVTIRSASLLRYDSKDDDAVSLIDLNSHENENVRCVACATSARSSSVVRGQKRGHQEFLVTHISHDFVTFLQQKNTNK